MKTSFFLAIISFSLSLSNLSAQNNFVSSGGNVSNASGSLSFSLGQIDYLPGTSTHGLLTPGVQQPFEPVLITNLIFTSMCSDNPSVSRTWRIRNPNITSLNVDWEVYGTTQKGTVVAPAGDSFFSTQTVANSANTTIISWSNEKGERKSLTKASGGSQCSASARIGSDEESEEPQPGTLSVHPNPGSKQITIEFFSERDAEAPVQIISSIGIVQATNYHQLKKGKNILTEDVTNFAAGVYVIQIDGRVIRFVKE